MKAVPIVITALICSFSTATSLAAATPAGETVLKPQKTVTAPKIDGIIEDTVWKETIVGGDLITSEPRYGDKLPMKTDIYMTYDDENIYFAFYCHDPEPEKIKTSITKRDGNFDDDFVAVSFDALGNRQRAYIFVVNPSGIQGDLIDTGSGGNDSSADWVWDSAASLDGTGYQVEMCIPLKSIQYASDADKPMRIAFFRKVSRIDTFASWPEKRPSDNFITMQAPVMIENLKTVRKLEILPSITYGNSSARKNIYTMERDSASELGGDISYSLNSSVAIDATFNPDYSQVEADAFQVNVNRRYPVFNSEKRPFYMEVNSLFKIAGTGGGNTMRTAVHTRRIADPDWSAKVSGTAGITQFGILAAEDAWNNPDAVSMANPRFLIARAKRSLEGGNYIGGIFTGRSAASDNNHVAGFDGVYRFRDYHQFEYSMLQSVSSNNGNSGAKGGNAAMLNYRYSTKPLYVGFSFENMTENFRMDTAFINRTGITRAGTYISPKFYPQVERFLWVNRITPSFGLDYVHDYGMQADDLTAELSINSNFSKNGYFNIGGKRIRENWENRAFFLNWFYTDGGFRPVKSLSLYAWGGFGQGIYYSDDPLRGDGMNYGAGFDLKPGERFTQSISFSHDEMKNPVGSETLYDVDIVNTRSTYQFNKYFFVRGIYQYNTVNKRQLVDVLASFTFIPGSVVQLGYGTLMEKGHWNEQEWRNNYGDVHILKKSLFFKTSYRHVF